MTSTLPAPRRAPASPVEDRLEVVFDNEAPEVDSAEPPLRRHRRKPKPLWARSPAVTISLGVIGISVIRVLILTGANFSEASVVLRVADRTQLLVGTATDLVLVVLAVSTLAMPMLRVLPDDGSVPGFSLVHRHYKKILFGLFVLGAIRNTIVTACMIMALAFAVRYLLYPACKLFYRKKAGAYSKAWGTAIYLIALLLAVSVGNVFTSPSTGKERFQLADGMIVGGVYVMGEEANNLVVMRKDRTLQWIPTDDIKARSLCVDALPAGDLNVQVHNGLMRSGHPLVAEFLTYPESTYPTCT